MIIYLEYLCSEFPSEESKMSVRKYINERNKKLSSDLLISVCDHFLVEFLV